MGLGFLKTHRGDRMNGYLLLIIGDLPHYRIIFCASYKEMMAALPRLKATIKGTIEVLEIVDGDTTNVYRTDTEIITE